MITERFSVFFKGLEQHNTKQWFHANTKAYATDVKAPFLRLLDEILPNLVDWDPRILPDPKKALFRINRDIRFTKDKSPYTTILKAGCAPGGRKSELPGYYLGIDAANVHVGGGLFMLQPSKLKKVRLHIAAHPGRLRKIVASSEFKETFGRLQGEKSKRLEKTLLPAAEKTDLIYHKQFYAFTEFPLAPFYGSDALTDAILEHLQIIKPLNDYLNEALI
ncbi:MAG: DUF2461 domain-containing protein [Bacteroidota bacterium]